MRSSNYEDQHAFWVKSLNFGYVLFIVITPVAGALLKVDDADISKWPPLVAPAFLFAKEHASWVVIAAPALAAICKYVAGKLENLWLRSLVRATLNKFADQIFHGLPGDVHHHRATLFKRVSLYFRYWPWKPGRWPWSGWLIPVSRSGHTTQKVRSYFLAPDDADRAEGIAGKVWARDNRIAIRNLPTLTPESPAADIAEYATKTWISEDWLRWRLAQPGMVASAFCGFPIEVKSRKWGVLVLDSREPDAHIAPDTEQEANNFEMAAYIIGKMLERW